VTDDVQVRNVEFYVDGVKVATDGNFPFEHHFVTPLRSAQSSSFRLRARASDTGGNATWSDEFVIDLVPDATPPRIRKVQPLAAAIVGSVDTGLAYFTEPINQSTLNNTSFKLFTAGADGAFGTADDVVVTGGTLSYRETINAAVLTFASNLAPGNYQAVVGPPIADLAGNAIAAPYHWSFRVFDKKDSDQDGVPDEIEILLGLNPFNSDSRGDGIRDGDRDFDNDGLS